MEQRRLRLGDILDDYCPRERRVTNHAIVAMIEEDVKQTRCTTCDAEHAYKGGKLPRRRKKETPAALYKEVLAGMSENDATPVLAVPSPATPDGIEPLASASDDAVDSGEVPAETIEASPTEGETASEEEPHIDDVPPIDEGPVHRPLIRATLPRPEGQKDTRPLPEFTVRHGGGRGGNVPFRGARPLRGHANHGGNGNGNRMPGGARFPGSRPSGQSRGPGGGRGNQGRGNQGGFRGRKRSR